jgi:hypothetical protein
VRYELPPGLTPEEERAIEAALREYFGLGRAVPSPWVLAGRAEALRLGALQVRHLSARGWTHPGLPLSRRGFTHRAGRGDTR